MAPVANDPNTLIGDFKNLYKESGLVNAIPSWMIIQDRFEFEDAECGLGQYYVFGVVLQKEQGVTYAPSSGVNSGVQNLNPAVAGYIGQAQVEGFAIYLRSRLSYDAAAKASRAGKKAFAQAYGAVLKNMKESHQFRVELSLLYGRDGIGVVEANAAGVITITAATYATGIWASGMRGAVLEFWSTAANPAVQHNGDLTIGSINVAARQITVVGVSAAVVAGILFNIDAAAYELWKAQTYAVGGNLSLTAIFNAAAIGMSFGLEKAVLICSPEKFSQLAADEAALRRYVQDTPNAKRGVKGISFMLGSVDVEILPHPLMKRGFAMVLSEESIHRVGATDVTFSMPGSQEPMQVHVTDSTALELRSMSDMGIFSSAPAQNVLMTGIA